MALDDPLAADSTPTQKVMENIFLVLYCTEMGLKILAYGFIFNPGSYLRDAWNILDFVIVVTSLLPFFITLSFSVNSLRAIRVLRPLKTITKVKVLKMIVKTLFLSFSLVLDSLYVLLFVMIIFAIAGLQLFSGVLKNRCIEEATGILSDTYCQAGAGDNCASLFAVGYYNELRYVLVVVADSLPDSNYGGLVIGDDWSGAVVQRGLLSLLCFDRVLMRVCTA
jgi:hypothetical protein